MAILLEEDAGEAVSQVAEREPNLVMSAATLAEALIVAGRQRLRPEMSALIEALDIAIVDLTAARARRAADAYARWGKGVHPARLNYGDCFAYALAQEHGCPLLYVGDDFARTDVGSAPAG